jgi:hypothetical protein
MFKREKEFIDKFEEETNKVYSVVHYLDPVKLTPSMLMERKYTIRHLDGYSLNGTMYHDEASFMSASGFLIYLSKSRDEDIYQMKIIYRTDQFDEVSLFIKNLTKLK